MIRFFASIFVAFLVMQAIDLGGEYFRLHNRTDMEYSLAYIGIIRSYFYIPYLLAIGFFSSLFRIDPASMVARVCMYVFGILLLIPPIVIFVTDDWRWASVEALLASAFTLFLMLSRRRSMV